MNLRLWYAWINESFLLKYIWPGFYNIICEKITFFLIERKLLNYYQDPFLGPFVKVNICVE